MCCGSSCYGILLSSSSGMSVSVESASSQHSNAQASTLTSAARPPTSLLFSRGNLVSSRMSNDRSTTARPSTAVRGVGYGANSAGSTGQRFDELFLEKAKQQTLSSTNATVDTKKEVNPQVKFKHLESKITKLLEASILLSTKNALVNNGTSTAELKSTLSEALNKAKEAFSLDRTLHQFRAQYGENIFHNFDLTYAVFFNLAEQYERNDMHIEALNTYSIMTKNKMFPHVNQLKLNMGNIYYKMGIYPKAIKMYRMALDSVPNNLKQLRLKITQNIGILFVRMGQYIDAASSFEFIMTERADIRSGIHSILCYYAMGDVEKIKSTFRNLCDIQPIESENDLEIENNIVKIQQHATVALGADADEQERNSSPFQQDVTPSIEKVMNEAASANMELDGNDRTKKNSDAIRKRYVTKALKCDELAGYVKQRRNNDKRGITMIVDLISPIIEENYNDGYNWCIEVIKTSSLSWLANELELNKALVYLRQNEVSQAIETLQMHNKNSEESMTASALINLSFIYINLSNFDMAAHCINQLNEFGVLQNNAMALVNASIIDYARKDYDAARKKLERALQIQPDNFEANYNLGLIGLQENNLELAEEQFENLKSVMMVPHSVQHSHVYFQLAKLQEKLHTNSMPSTSFRHTITQAALQSYLQVLGISAADTDSRLFDKVGSIYEQVQDHQEANQYYNEAYRINPSDINTASSIGSYYIKLQATEKAIYYYERAVLANPNDPNLMLRVASCFRNSYLPSKQYLGIFQKIYNRFPDNLTCVRALVQVTKSLGLTDLHEKYSLEYARLHKVLTERQNDQRYQQQRLSSATSSRGNGRFRESKNNIEDASLRRCVENVEAKTITSGFNGDQYLQNLNSNMTATHPSDPLGPPAERPRTGMAGISQDHDSDDEINTDSLLPM
ncbi:intraflagellar transport protein 88 homolog isoform X1 [Bactrocera dorsalis]|uniref:Intraflagellar transport protein 88 homolog isoform X1 n=1 Tax=Bactrocera dorsalis TaxID=27457 RepID=A0ABM3J684_BACDO|nr:intraflagellar transport protein 88 homolog isoform X1 [Bactrocera dorsalis]